MPEANRNTLSDAVDVGIVSGMGSARNNINVLSSDVVVTCGQGGVGTASGIAPALKSKNPVILLNDRDESIAFFRSIGGDFIHPAKSVADAIALARALLTKA